MSSSAGPSVSSGPDYKGYEQPANWNTPTVSGQNLMVHTSTLRSVASELSSLAAHLGTALSSWQSMAGSAAGGLGSWTAAQSLAKVVNSAHAGVQQFAGELRQAHSDTATRLGMSADRYEDNEQALAGLANRSTAAGSTIVGAGGNNTPVDPSPAQARVLALERHMMGPGDNENWQASFPVTDNASFDAGSTGGLHWQDVKSMLDATDPTAISNAGTAYHQIASALTDVASKLSGQGQSLAADWGGSTAVTAVSQVQQLWQTAADLQANTFAAGAALQWYGGVLQTFKDTAPTAATPSVTRGAHESAAKYQAAVTSANNAANNAADQAAQQHLAQLNQHAQTAFENMPPALNKNLPPPLASNGGNTPAPAVTGGGGGGLTGGGMPGGSGGAAPGVTAPSGSSGPAPVGPLPVAGSSPGSGYHLSGGGSPVLTSPPPGPTTPPVTTLPSPGPTGPGPIVLPPPPVTGQPGPTGGQPGPGDPVTGEPVPGEPVPGDPGPVGVGPIGEPSPDTPGIGPDGMITGPGGEDLAAGDGVGGLVGEAGGPGGVMPMMGMPGGSGGQFAVGRDRETFGSIEDEGTWNAASGDNLAASAGADGPGVMPMMGTQGGSGDQFGLGRDRETFGTGEDEGTWGAEDGAADDAFPGMMPLGSTSQAKAKERDRFRQAWMDEDEDVWGTGQPVTPPVISPN